MAHVRHERALGDARLLRRGLGDEQLLLCPSMLFDLELEQSRALDHALLETAARLEQLGVALFDCREHLVEAVDELPDLVLVLLGRAK
ncbi:MAG: hypothetical protein QM736_20360 [Vicinamibacterales bacterium]